MRKEKEGEMMRIFWLLFENGQNDNQSLDDEI